MKNKFSRKSNRKINKKYQINKKKYHLLSHIFKKMYRREIIEYLCQNKLNINRNFLDKYLLPMDKFQWECIANDIQLTEDFCEKYFDLLNQGYLFLRQNLSNEFIDKYLDINAVNLLDNKFIVAHELSQNKFISKEIKDKYTKMYNINYINY